MEENRTSPPSVDCQGAIRLAEKLFGIPIDPKSVKQFVGYDDKNFYLKSSSKAPDDGGSPAMSAKNFHTDGYVLKVTNEVDSRDPEFLSAQNCAMSHLASKKFSCPRPVPNLEGELLSVVKLGAFFRGKSEDASDTEEPCVVRMLTFLPGKTLYEVSPWTAELFFQAGQFIGEMDEAWKDFHHPVFADRECIWYLKDVLKVRDFVSAVDNKAQQEMCNQILDEFETRVRSRLGEFDSGQIHGDYNEQNILVRRKDNSVPAGSTDGNDYIVSGVIDFGDIIESPYVFEIGTTVMYTMLHCTGMDKNEVGGHVLAGYEKIRGPLSPLELDVLPVVAAARFVQSLVLGAHYFKQNPENEYVLVTAKGGGWETLTDFWAMPRGELFQLWSRISTSYSN